MSLKKCTLKCERFQVKLITILQFFVAFFSAVGAVALGDQLYVCGGFDGISSLDTVEKFDPMTNTWTLVASMTKNRSAAGKRVLYL
jgi:hypothetical protein